MLHITSSRLTDFSDNLIYTTKVISKYLSTTVSYLIQQESSTWYFSVTIFIALYSDRHISQLTISVVANYPSWALQVVTIFI